MIKNLFLDWKLWTLLYLISAVLFAQTFKKSNKNMTDPGILTILLQIFTSFFALLFIPFFKLEFSINNYILGALFSVVIIYAITDRLNIESRYGLEPSQFSMLKQLSTVFLIILGILFMREEVTLNKMLGSILIVGANIFLTYNKGKFNFNKYFIMSIIANLLFAIAMFMNINISNSFNIGIYTFITVFFPALLIFILGRYKIKNIILEFNRYDKKKFVFAASMWALMLVSSVKAYQYGEIIVVATLFTLTSLLNSIVEFIFNKNTEELAKKIFVFLIILIGVCLIRMF